MRECLRPSCPGSAYATSSSPVTGNGWRYSPIGTAGARWRYTTGPTGRLHHVLHLSPSDTRMLAELFGASPVSEASWPCNSGGGAGHRLGDHRRNRASSASASRTAFRARTGASIVAGRGDETIPAPGPDEGLPDDVVVAVGTTEGLAELRELLLS